MQGSKALFAVALMLAFAMPSRAQDVEGGYAVSQILAAWQTSNATCLDRNSAALEAIAACEQRDTLSKRLAQLNYCDSSPEAKPTTNWQPCSRDSSTKQNLVTIARFQRMGGVFVVPLTINGTLKSYGIVDSGATHVQIPEETVEEMRRNGSLTDADFLGQKRYTLADGRGVQQRAFRLRSLQIGDKTMENLTAAVGARRSRVLLGQSFLRRLSSWKIDNVKNEIELEFSGPS